MDDSLRLEEIKKTHDRLYRRVLNEQSVLLNDETKLAALVKDEIDPLLNDIQALTASTTSPEEFNWLRDAAIKWQLVLSAILKIPRTVQITPRKEPLERAPIARILSGEEVMNWVDKRASEFSRQRRLNQAVKDPHFIDRFIEAVQSTKQEMDLDWQNAQIDFAYQVLYGQIDFAQQLEAKTYDYLERIRLRDVKQLRAYFIWENRGSPWDPEHGRVDYYQACEEIRDLLVNDRFKATPRQFEEARAYLETQYLTDGHVVWGEKQTNLLVESKVRAAEPAGHESDLDIRRTCQAYVQMFYENIIPAVRQANDQSILAVLKAFQLGGRSEDRHPMINSFEAALGVYFLDRSKILEIWKGSREKLYP